MRKQSSQLRSWSRRAAALIAVAGCFLAGSCGEVFKVRLAGVGFLLKPQMLVDAAASGDLVSLHFLMLAGVPPSARGDLGLTPLMAAAREGRFGAVKRLLRKGALADAREAGGLSALSFALEGGNRKVSRRLLEAGASPDISTGDGCPALVAMAAAGDMTMVDLLLAHGADTGVEDADRLTPLSWAARAGNLEMAARFLTAGADPNAPAGSGQTALADAVERGDEELAGLLLAHGADVNRRQGPGTPLLALAVFRNDTGLANRLLRAGAAPDPQLPARGSPLLVEAIAGSDFDLAKTLLQRGSDPNQLDPAGGSALAHALRPGADPRLAPLLLRYGASPRDCLLKAVTGETDGRVLRLLLAHGVDPGLRLPDGDTLLAASVRHGEAWTVERLLAEGADPNVPGRDGCSPLGIAVLLGDAAKSMSLLRHGAEADAYYPKPAGSFIERHVRTKLMRFYMQKESQITPLMVAADLGHTDIVRALYGHGASRGKRTRRYGIYPISFASMRGQVDAMRILLNQDPERTDRDVMVRVNLSNQRAELVKDGKVINSTKVSTGRKGYRTPTGNYVITHKYRNWTSTIYKVPMPYFQRLSCAAFGFHSSNHVPSYPASHGCIRMPWSKARQFFSQTKPGDRVVISY